MPVTARIVLDDGSVFEGEAFGHPSNASGEVVFNTGMVGYPETLTDPSYRGQILVLTYPLVGNYGVTEFLADGFGLPRGAESWRIQVAGLVVSEHCLAASHASSVRTLEAWLTAEGIPAVAGVDTRALTKRLRHAGTMPGTLSVAGAEDEPSSMTALDIMDSVIPDGIEPLWAGDSREPGEGPTVVLLDCGAKAHIARSLLRRGLNVIRVPADQPFLHLDFDGIVVSNGPGDPKAWTGALRNVERALALGQPILGICLGNQLLSLAIGADTYKLPFGHRSQNQPCLVHGDRSGPRPVYLTSQNHGYAVSAPSLPCDWKVWFTNANDGTVEGIRHESRPFMGVQFHPEAMPGPVDTAWIFDEFADRVCQAQPVLT